MKEAGYEPQKRDGEDFVILEIDAEKIDILVKIKQIKCILPELSR